MPTEHTDTIVAISTPPGRGGIGIVRLAGAGALAVAEALVVLQRPLEAARAVFARVRDADGAGRTLDEAVVTAFLAPHSYTGDDLVEIAAHGSPVVLQAILGEALRLGARLAGPGEFTQRAFLAGRLDLAQAEAVQDLIAAQTLDQARVAAGQMGGGLARRLAPVKEQLLHLIAVLEAGMDFASGELDDVDVVPTEAIAAAVAAVQEPLGRLAAGFRQGMLLREGASLALVGPPNAGKSSLFNRLLQRERAIVTAMPGTTRDTLEETAVLATAMGAIPVRLMDTAGLREAVASAELDEAEALGMARSREALAEADVVVMVHDASQRFSAAESTMLEELLGLGRAGGGEQGARPVVVAWNKIDLLAEPPVLPALVAGAKVVCTSASTGEGLDALRSAVVEALGAGGVAELALVSNRRQQAALEQALAALAAAVEANLTGMPHEVILLDLHAALAALDALTGQTTTEDVLARIFATFCIGK